MTGSAGVMALVLAETVAGTAALLWFTPLWREVKRGYFTLNGVILTILAFAAWRAADAGAIVGDDAGMWSVRLTLAMLHRDGGVDRRCSSSSRTRSLVAWASSPSRSRSRCWSRCRRPGASIRRSRCSSCWPARRSWARCSAGCLLGHWYLTDRGLSRTPIERATHIMLVAVVIEAIAVISGGFGGVGSSDAFNPLLTAGALAPWIALGMVGTTGLIAVMVKATLRGARASAVQSATGFFYLAVVTAFTAEVAVKTRFLPV